MVYERIRVVELERDRTGLKAAIVTPQAKQAIGWGILNQLINRDYPQRL
jgi:hypothetical protein